MNTRPDEIQSTCHVGAADAEDEGADPQNLNSIDKRNTPLQYPGVERGCGSPPIVKGRSILDLMFEGRQMSRGTPKNKNLHRPHIPQEVTEANRIKPF